MARGIRCVKRGRWLCSNADAEVPPCLKYCVDRSHPTPTPFQPSPRHCCFAGAARTLLWSLGLLRAFTMGTPCSIRSISFHSLCFKECLVITHTFQTFIDSVFGTHRRLDVVDAFSGSHGASHETGCPIACRLPRGSDIKVGLVCAPCPTHIGAECTVLKP